MEFALFGRGDPTVEIASVAVAAWAVLGATFQSLQSHNTDMLRSKWPKSTLGPAFRGAGRSSCGAGAPVHCKESEFDATVG